MWYTAFGALTTIFIAGLGTFITGVNATHVDLKLLAPCLRHYMRVDDRIKKLPKKSHPNRNVIPELDEDSFGDKESAL